MVITKVIRYIDPEQTQHPQREVIELTWEELNKRIWRKKTNRGREVRLALEEGTLRRGAVLYEETDLQIVVETRKEEAYIIYPDNMQAMGKVAFELGNRHTPALIEENRIVVRYDYTLELLFQEAGVHYEHTFYRFPEPFRYRGHHHAHHTHSAPSSAHS